MAQTLRLKRLGIDTYKEAVVYIHKDCPVCRSEGFEAPARIQVILDTHSIIATLNTIDSDLLSCQEISLSNYAWELLGAHEGDEISLAHPKPLDSMSFIRSKVYGHTLSMKAIKSIVSDIVTGRLSDIHIATFLTASAGNHLNMDETTDLTQAMVQAGEQLG